MKTRFLRLIALVLTAAVLLSGCGMVDFDGYFGAVRSLVDAHCSGKADLRKPLWTLLVLQLWLRARGM